MNFGEIKDEILKLSNQEGNRQLSPLLPGVINSIMRGIEKSPGAMIQGLPVECEFAYQWREIYLKSGEGYSQQGGTTTTGHFLFGEDGGYAKFKKMDSFFVSMETPDNFFPLSQMAYRDFVTKYKAGIYSVLSPALSPYAVRGTPEAYTLIYEHYPSPSDQADKVYRGQYAPAPENSITHYKHYSYYVYSDKLESDDDENFLTEVAPDVLIYGTLYQLAVLFNSEGDMNAFYPFFRSHLIGLCEAHAKNVLDVSGSETHLSVSEGLDVI